MSAYPGKFMCSSFNCWNEEMMHVKNWVLGALPPSVMVWFDP